MKSVLPACAFFLFLTAAHGADRAGLKSADEVVVWRTLVEIAKEGPAGIDAVPEIAALFTESWEGRRRSRFCYYALRKILGDAASPYDPTIFKLIAWRFNGKSTAENKEGNKNILGPELPADLLSASNEAWELSLDAALPKYFEMPRNKQEHYQMENAMRKLCAPPELVVPRAAKVLLDAKQTESARSRAAELIGSSGPWEGSTDPLVKAMSDPNPKVRLRAACNVGTLGHIPKVNYEGSRPPYPHPAKEKAVDALKKALKDTDVGVRHCAVEGLRLMYNEAVGALPELEAAFKTDKDASVRESIANICGGMMDAKAAPLLLLALRDPSVSIFKSAALATLSLKLDVKTPDVFKAHIAEIEKRLAVEKAFDGRDGIEASLKRLKE